MCPCRAFHQRGSLFFVYPAARSWSYLLWAIKLIWRGAPKKKWIWYQIVGSILRHDQDFFLVNLRTIAGMYESILHIKMAEWLLLEAAQTSLSNLLLLAVSYDIMLHFSWIVCPCFMRNKRIRLRWAERKTKKRKAAPSYFRAWIRLLCPWHLIECTVHLFATSRLSLSNSAGARRQHRCTPGLVGGLRIKKLETQTVVVSDTWYYILFPMNNYF